MKFSIRSIGKTKWLFLALAYFIANILFHTIAEKPFFWFVEQFGQVTLKYVMSGILFLLLGIIVMKTLPLISKHSHKSILISTLAWACLGSVIGYCFLMPYKSEGMHFVQYGIGGIVSLFAFRNIFSALTFSYFFGILDETYQVYVMGSLYLDFNDMVLNFWGSLLGVTLTSIFFKWQSSDMNSWSRQYFFISCLVYVIFFGITYMLGICTHYQDDGGWFHLLNHDRNAYNPSFWYQVAWGDIWHQFRPLPGFILILLLPSLFGYLRKFEIVS